MGLPERSSRPRNPRTPPARPATPPGPPGSRPASSLVSFLKSIRARRTEKPAPNLHRRRTWLRLSATVQFVCLRGRASASGRQAADGRTACAILTRRATTTDSAERKLASDSFASAEVAKLADAPDLGSGGATRRGSTPLFRTNLISKQPQLSPLRALVRFI